MINNYIRGGQIFLHKMRMLKQVWDQSLIFAFIIALLITSYYSYSKFLKLDYTATITYAKAIGSSYIENKTGKIIEITAASDKGIYSKHIKAKDVLRHSGFKKRYEETISLIISSLVKLIGITAIGFTIIVLIWSKFGSSSKSKTILKGGKIFSPKEVMSFLKKNNRASSFEVAGMPLVKDSETSHILITGTTGSGKTTCMNELLPQIRTKNQSAIIVDYTGSMTEKYYDKSRGDIVIGAASGIIKDQVSSWDFWQDVRDEHNLKIIAHSLFADKGGGYDEMWNNASSQFFKDSVECIIKEAKIKKNNPKVMDLYDMLAKAKLGEVNKRLKGYASSSMIDPINDKTAMSIRTNTIAFINWMENFVELKNKCSITNWFENVSNEATNSTGKWLFLRSSPKQRASMRNFHSMLLDLCINQLMELGENHNRRIWMIIDELPALKKLPSLAPALSEFRKYGGCIMASLQSPHQLFEIYGQHSSYAMLDQFNTKFIFRTDEHNFANYLCKGFGEVEYQESSENYSYGAHEMRDGVSTQVIEKKKPLLTPSDLASLDNLEAYVKLPEKSLRIAKIKLSI